MLTIVILLLSFNIRGTYASEAGDSCPQCGTGVLTLLYEQSGEYVDNEKCQVIYTYECTECGYREAGIKDAAHKSASYDVKYTPYDKTSHKVTGTGICERCGHSYKNEFVENHHFEWKKAGVKKVFKCKECGEILKIRKAKNPLSVKGKTTVVKYDRLKNKSQNLSVKKIITFKKKGKGKMSYRLASVSKAKYKEYFKINKKTGRITIKKGLPKGIYSVRVKIKAAGNGDYKASDVKSVMIKMTIK